MSTLTSNSYEPSSSKTPQHRYDVFLSFRGEDVRDNFLEHFYRALFQRGISIFKDDAELEHGKRINDGLFKAIVESRFSIVVLSQNYADSSWCLSELAQILEFNRDNGQDLQKHVYPVFYRVSPSDVRKQKGAFGEGFAKACLGKEEEEVKRWRDALEEVGNLKGWDYPNAKFENEANLISDIVDKIFNISNGRSQIPDENLFGIKSRMMEVINLLDLGSDKTQIVGLWGMGGIGKTTLATAVYDFISWQFEGCSFINDVSEAINSNAVLALQKQLISDILGEENFKVLSVASGRSIIHNRVCRKKVLIVLDGVNNAKQVNDLVGELQRFYRGSRIIITSRDKQVLVACGVQHVVNVRKLDKDEAMQLIKSKAFAENGQIGEFHRLIDRTLQYADGIPLALKVLGSLLLGGTITEWESLLDRLGDSLDDELQKVLKISYDGLSWKDKQIFLDICCFFKGLAKDRVVKILDGCDFNAEYGIGVLEKKSLLSISMGKLWMHDLIQKLGWSIVDEESIKEPGERSRLWRPNDAKQVLEENTGTKEVEGLWLSSQDYLQLRPDSFAKMRNMRILAVCCAKYISIELPNKLRYLHWVNYHWKCMSSAVQPQHLVELHLTNNCIEQLWNGKMDLSQLSLLELSDSRYLTKSPDLNGCPNLENLLLRGCTKLVDLDPSIKYLKKLKHLDLKNCTSLQTLPCGIKSQCLKTLIFSGCWKLDNILESFEDLKQLEILDMDGTDIRKLSESIGNSADLLSLNCSGCSELRSIPHSISHLKKLRKLSLKECYRLIQLPYELELSDSLVNLDLENIGVDQLPASALRLKSSTTLFSSKILRRILLGLLWILEFDTATCPTIRL